MNSYEQYREDWERFPREGIVSDFPLHIDIELTNRCSEQCRMCPFHGPDATNKRPPQDMDFELYKKIIDEGVEKGLCSIKLNFSGEPLLYIKLPEAIKYAKDRGILDVQINTNATLFTINKLKKMIKAGLDLMIITDYKIPHQLSAVVAIHLHKKIHRFTKPIVRIKTDDPEKWGEYADETVSNVYYDYCNLNEVFTASDYKCSQPWQRMLILSDGTICRCSCGFVNEEKMFGNVKYITIEYAWKHYKMKFLRSCHEQGYSHLVRMCRSCPARNEYIGDIHG